MNSVLWNDEDDGRLVACVRPPDWRNPAPQPLYDLVVIGGGTAGLVCAAGAAGLGARVALIERARLGGDCLNTGCVPSKALLRSARAAGEARAGSRVGVVSEPRVDFHAVMTRMRTRRADIAPHDSAARLRSLGVDVFFGDASFSDRRTVSVGGAVLRFSKAVIATGSRPAIPPIDGLDGVRFFTNETIFDLTEQPRHLAVLGGGPIGCELAQAFARLGTQVTLIESAGQLLSQEDADAAEIVARSLAADGVDVRTNVRVTSVSRRGPRIRLVHAGAEAEADCLLVATGRAANVERLGLEAAGVSADANGIRVSDAMRTTNRRIYASGDVASRFRFTHAADALSRIVVQNALFFGRKRASSLVIPWCTFTDPELAHVGITSAAAEGQHAETITIRLREVDRAVLDDAADGFVRVHHRGGRMLGATIVAPAAGELIGTITCAMQAQRSLGEFSSIVFPYPTLSLALRQAGDAYRREQLTPTARKALRYYFDWRRWAG
jgi:pyruvate/2-oxoglutarate dehydrogenase complex dihydrolipoamide dehydrogenase (E3) component